MEIRDLPSIPISRVFVSSSILAKPVSRSSGFDTSIATTLVSTLYLAAKRQIPFVIPGDNRNVPISSATS